MIEFAAPGKAVIWGEYAVLEGAPAMVMALNRYATTRIEPAGDLWDLAAAGFSSSAVLSTAALMQLEPVEREGVAGLIRAAVSALGDPELPVGARIRTDTRAFYADGRKLGIGSSAAVCTAACAAMAGFLGLSFDQRLPLAAHRALQGKSGSGLDVAAACRGGLIRFHNGSSSTASWPEKLHYRYLWVGHAAKTSEHLARFNDWRAAGDTRTLDALCQASERLFQHPDLSHLNAYVSCLERMDAAGHLGIFTEPHQRLRELANRSQVVYKPCGAGGGDIGIAVSDDSDHLEELIALATRDSFLTLDLEIAAYGVHQIRS